HHHGSRGRAQARYHAKHRRRRAAARPAGERAGDRAGRRPFEAALARVENVVHPTIGRGLWPAAKLPATTHDRFFFGNTALEHISAALGIEVAHTVRAADRRRVAMNGMRLGRGWAQEIQSMTTIPRLNETALFRRTLARAITLPVFLLIVLALIFLWQLNSLLDAAHWVDHTDQTIAKAHTLQELLIDQETGLRGYAITGVPDFLDPYRQAQAAIDPTFDELDGLVADNTAQQALVKAIRSNYGRWLVYSRELIGVRDRGGDYAGFVQHRTGKQLMDAMRAQIQSFLRIQVALRDQRS